MPKKSFIPSCNFGEKINISISTYESGDRNFTFDFPVKITQEDTSGKNCNIWIDTSGSLSEEKVFEAQRAAYNSFQNAILDSSERWLQWFSFSFLQGNSALAYINESSIYDESENLFVDDLIFLNKVLAKLKTPVVAKLLIINDQPNSGGLITQFEDSNLINSSYNIDYDVIDAPDATQVITFINDDKNTVEIFSLPGWEESLLRQFKNLGLLKISDILESLFVKKLVSIESKRLITVKSWCGDSECPPGCCKVCSPHYPYYCCVKFNAINLDRRNATSFYQG
jgi:hypothetical protein